MKKIFMTLAAVAVSATMSAQVYVGGTFGLNFQNKLVDVNATSGQGTGLTFQIKPEIGYALNENSAVGIVIGFGTTNNGNTQFNGQPLAAGYKLAKSATTFEIAPYYRYTFLKLDKVNFFIDGQLSFDYQGQDSDNNTTAFGLAVKPGVAVNLNDKISFVAKLGDGLGFTSTKQKIGGISGDSQSKFGLGVNSLAALDFGLYYNF